MTRVSLGLKEDFPTYLFWGKLNFGTNLVLSKQHNIVLVRVLADMTFLSTHRFDSECLFKKLMKIKLLEWYGKEILKQLQHVKKHSKLKLI